MKKSRCIRNLGRRPVKHTKSSSQASYHRLAAYKHHHAFSSKPDYQTEIFDKRIPCITAQTIERQLVSKVQGINLIGASSHIAKKAFNGIGTANMAMHRLGEGIKRQEMLFIFA